MNKRCIIIGAGHAASQLAMSLRQQGWQDDILVIGDEASLPYQRPPLSKSFLSGEKNREDILIRAHKVYEDANVRFRLDSRVASIDRKNKLITLQSGEEIGYSKLALCTGSTACKISLPGHDKKGVFYLRNLEDAENIRDHAHPGKHAIIIGGGYIGLETASALNQLGMQVTVLEAQDRILKRVACPQVSDFFQRLHTKHGVKLVNNAFAAAIAGEQSVTGVSCQQGNHYPAHMVIIGVGISPQIVLAQDAGLNINNGIVIDKYATTSDPHIVAAGDCTSFYHRLYESHVRLESIQNAMEQAKSAAASICAKQLAYDDKIPRFWSDQYHLKLQIVGLFNGYDQMEVRGDINSGEGFAAFYLKDNRLIAACAVNQASVLNKAQQHIKLAREITSEDIDVMIG